MITGTLRSKVDKLWDEFWTGGISNPLTVIEQITFLMFTRLLDIRETTAEKQWTRTNPGKPYKGLYGPGEQKLRWQNFSKCGGEEMLKVVRDEVFPHLRKLGQAGSLGDFMKDASLMIQKASLLVSAVTMIDQLPLTGGDTKGDLYEYLLSKLTTAGINGQFRTPRHIIRLMVDLVFDEAKDREELTWTVGDPAAGTGGFLVSVVEHLMQRYTSDKGRIEEGVNGEKQITYTGDLLSREERKNLSNKMLHGFDFDVTMLRIASMNLMFHGVDTPSIHYQDTLSNSFPERFPKLASEAFDLILANPPFKGSLDYGDVHPSILKVVKTKKTELLFIAQMLQMLKLGGRCAVIVPDGVLFGSSNAHVDLRKTLVEENQLDAVIKLPAGVFKPYAGVSTAILIFTKGGKTNDVWFYDVQADGFSLDDKRDPVAENDLPDVRVRWSKRNSKKDTDRKGKAFFVPKADIIEQDYDLSLNRYKEIVHEEVKYDSPKTILKRLKKLEAEIDTDLQELEAMLG
jgi:type I restriction enzyme M protein